MKTECSSSGEEP